MRDEDKTRRQLIDELMELRRRIAEFEASERERDKEEELRQARKYAQDIIQSSLDMIIAVDEDRKIIEFNRAAEETFGYSREEILGEHVEILYSDPEDEGLAVHEAAKKAGRFTGEVTNKRKNGESFPSFLCASVLRDTKGRFLGVMGISRDITERKQAEERLRQSRQRLELALRGAALGLWDWNIQTGEVVSNDRCAEMLGYLPDEIAPHISSWERLVHPDDMPRVEEVLNAHLEGRTPFYETEHRLRVKTGGWKWVLDRGQVVERDDDGNPLRAAGTRLDITERKRMEEERIRVSKLESVGALAGSIAHDFNDILTAVLGNISLAGMYLKTGETADKVLEKLKEAETASAHARDLTQQLLTFSRGRSSTREVISIAGILRESANFALRGSSVRCEFSTPDDLWQVKVDEEQMSQVISNLVINADQAMPEGGTIKAQAQNVTLRAEDALPLKDGEYVRISIEDQGIGIPEEYLQKIFDPYFTTKRKDRGLGLATSYSIIKNHGGHITVESKLGVGSTFCIYLPACPDLGSPSQALESPRTRGSE